MILNGINIISHHHTPDVLDCIANLSNDEVFTSPKLANQMLDILPQELFQSKETKFLDPFTKSGIFLREITKRLDKGLENQIKNRKKRIEHILKNQVFGIAITELTSLLARRTLYCAKKANSEFSLIKFNDEKGNIIYDRINHTWEKNKCIFCGASQKEFEYRENENLETYAYQFIHTENPEEFFNMKFDVIIGNPPYQLNDGGAQASAIPLYHKFVEQAKKLNPKYLTMIIPARWYAGGKGLDTFRKEMLNDKRIRVLHDFLSAKDCFNGVEIKGGVCYFLWNRDNEGLCKIFTHTKDKVVESKRYLLENNLDIYLRFKESVSIVKKVLDNNFISLSEEVSSRKPFGFSTNFNDFKNNEFQKSVNIFANKKIGYVERNKIEKNIEWVDKYKVLVPKAIGIGNLLEDRIKPILAKKNTCCTETYIVLKVSDSEKECENLITYINTKFFHFLLSLKKVTQDTTKNVYYYIPLQDFKEPWTDDKLYKKYNLEKEEIEFIEKNVRSMED